MPRGIPRPATARPNWLSANIAAACRSDPDGTAVARVGVVYHPNLERPMRSNRALLLSLTGVLSACDASGPSTQGRVEMNVATRPAAGASASAMSLAVTSPTPGSYTDGTN